jgi:hypothetical protein
MAGRDLSTHHTNNNLKAAISFANYLGTENPFHNITRKQLVIAFLDTKKKSLEDDPDSKWIINKHTAAH